MSKRLAVPSQHQASRGVLVEPVGERRRPRQAVAQGVEMVFEAAAALRPAVHRHPGGLVDDQHQAVAVEHAGQHRFRGHLSGLFRRVFKRCFKWHDETGITAADMNDSISEPGDSKSGEARQSWWRRLRGGLARTSASIATAITDLVSKRKLDAGVLEELEDVLIRADLGVGAAARIAAAVGEGRYDKTVSADEVKAILAAEIEKILVPVAIPLAIDPACKPFVILVAGVNGSGKTTTIGKLAARFSREGRRVMLAAGDTFRAAAIEQLQDLGRADQKPRDFRRPGRRCRRPRL